MNRIPFTGSGVLDDGDLRTPVVSIIATNQRSDPLLVKFVLGNFAHGDTILRCEMSFEVESPPETPPKAVGDVMQIIWPMHGMSLKTVDGPDLAAVLAVDGYSVDDFLSTQTEKKSVLRLIVKPEVFAPFASLLLWPNVAADDPDPLDMGEFVSKPPFIFEFDATRLIWHHVSHPSIHLPIR
ncbi:MAG: hypothetical protein ABIH23_01580 [bacterium]